MGDIRDLEPILLSGGLVHFNAKIASISTAMLLGNEFVPTALLAPMPLSAPQTSAAADTVRRAEQWCVRVATGLGARP